MARAPPPDSPVDTMLPEGVGQPVSPLTPLTAENVTTTAIVAMSVNVTNLAIWVLFVLDIEVFTCSDSTTKGIILSIGRLLT